MTVTYVRWQQPFTSFTKALAYLTDANEVSKQGALSRLEKLGFIHTFECTHELAWNTLREFLTFQGIPDLVGSRDTTRAAFARKLIVDGEGWMMMLSDRNRTSHTYNEATAEEIAQNIHTRYVDLFCGLVATLQPRLGDA